MGEAPPQVRDQHEEKALRGVALLGNSKEDSVSNEKQSPRTCQNGHRQEDKAQPGLERVWRRGGTATSFDLKPTLLLNKIKKKKSRDPENRLVAVGGR